MSVVKGNAAQDKARRAELDELLAMVKSDARSTAIVEGAKAEGLTAGQAALRLVAAGFAPVTEAAWRAEFDGSPSLKAEFGSVDVFLAYKKAVAGGLVKFHGPGR